MKNFLIIKEIDPDSYDVKQHIENLKIFLNSNNILSMQCICPVTQTERIYPLNYNTKEDKLIDENKLKVCRICLNFLGFDLKVYQEYNKPVCQCLRTKRAIELTREKLKEIDNG